MIDLRLGLSASGEGGTEGSSQIAISEAANVTRSRPYAPGSPMPAMRTPPIAGPRTRASVKTTSSTAIAASSWPSPTSRRRQRIPRRPLERVGGGAESLRDEQEPDAGVREERIREQSSGDGQERDVREKEQPAAIDGIRDRPAVERHDQQWNERGNPEQADEQVECVSS